MFFYSHGQDFLSLFSLGDIGTEFEVGSKTENCGVAESGREQHRAGRGQGGGNLLRLPPLFFLLLLFFLINHYILNFTI